MMRSRSLGTALGVAAVGILGIAVMTAPQVAVAGQLHLHTAARTFSEVTGGAAHTWSEPKTASGIPGTTIPTHDHLAITCRRPGFKVADGNTWWYQVASKPWSNQFFVSADAFYNNGKSSGPLKGTPFVDPKVAVCPTPYPTGVAETAGGVAHTWTNASNAGGIQGPSVPSGSAVLMGCRLQAFRVQDGNTWWYEVASTPWASHYFVSADAFYNNGATTGSLHGTPFVDLKVPVCPGSGTTTTTTTGVTTTTAPAGGPWPETTGGVTHTWTDYASAGGTEGPSISSNATVQITCRAVGFAVADGNTWWYLIASSPWSGSYWASADAFYNNGATSGTLHGTPFVDSAVATCSGSTTTTTPGSTTTTAVTTTSLGGPWPETTGGVTHTWSDYTSAGGNQGPSISSFQTVQVSCRRTGFQVADGNTWWYRVASSPWSDTYWASADAFYNNGATGGSLRGTPWVDTAVAIC